MGILRRRGRQSYLAGECVDADLNNFSRFDLAMALGEMAREFGADYGNGARVAGLAQSNRNFARARCSLVGKLLDDLAAFKNIAVARDFGLVHQHLLGAQAERLFGLIGQRECFAKARQLKGVYARLGREDDRQSLVRNPDDIHFGLRFGERQ